MGEFLSILISFIFMSLADSVDSAFNNYISIDAIVACGCLIFIKLIIKSIGEIGLYTYRVVRKDESPYLIISFLISLIIGIILFFSSNVIVNLYGITEVQKGLLSNILKIFIIYFPTFTVCNMLLEYTILKKQLKLYRISLFVYYFFLILFDPLAFILTKSLIWLFIASVGANIICSIYLLYKLKIKFEKITKEHLKNINRFGITLMFERLISRSLILIYGVLASNLNTNDYAIHTICYGVAINLELITNAYHSSLMIKIPDGKTSFDQKEIMKSYMYKLFGLIAILYFVFAIIYLFISHGSLPIEKCFPYIIFYVIDFVGLMYYESYRALLYVQGKVKVLLYGSVGGSFIRILCCFIFLKTPIALYVFGLSNLLDFYIRSVIFRLVLKRNY